MNNELIGKLKHTHSEIKEEKSLGFGLGDDDFKIDPKPKKVPKKKKFRGRRTKDL